MSKWREQYKVHPAADVFPMMSDEELAKLGEDIKANGLTVPLILWNDFLIDGRNRLEAIERIGLNLPGPESFVAPGRDPVTFIISANIHRRHLTKQQQADLIVAAIKAGEKLDQVEPVSKGGRGKKSPIKEKAVAEAKKHGISEATVKRSIARAEGKKPRPSKPRGVVGDEPRKPSVALQIVRDAAKSAREIARVFHEDAVEIDDELIRGCQTVSTIWDKLTARLIKKRASTLPQDGRSEGAVGDPAPKNGRARA